MSKTNLQPVGRGDGWTLCCMHDDTGRRGIWFRERREDTGALTALEVCAGREGGDDYAVVTGVAAPELLACLQVGAWMIDECGANEMRNDMSKTIRAGAGGPYKHVPDHTYCDADLVAREGKRGAMATIAIVWGSAQGHDEEHGRREYTRRGPSLEDAIDAVRAAALNAEDEVEVRGYIETACSCALATTKDSLRLRANRAIECAKDYTADDDAVAVDDGAHVEKVDGGYWVAARVWVSDAVFEAHVSWDTNASRDA